jgi:cytoskeleton protein RodZ
MTELPGTGESVTPGAALGSAREAAGLSVADVAAQMRISSRQVQALEADRYADLPGAVFVRGFIRNYARVLKLDPIPLLHALEPALAQAAPLRAHATSGTLPVPARRDHSRLLLVLLGVLFVAVIVAGGYELWSSRQKEQASATLVPAQPTKLESVHPEAPVSVQPTAQTPAERDSVDSLAPASAGLPQDSVSESPPAAETEAKSELSDPLAPASASLPVDSASRLPPAADRPVAPGPAVAEPAPPDTSSRAPESRSGRIGMQFTHASWVEIRDREGNVVFSGTGQAGSERNFEALPPLSVVIGNAGGVRMTYNGKALDVASHVARGIARFTLE